MRSMVSNYEHDGIAAYAAAGGDVKKLRALAPLPADSQMIIDDAFIRVGQQELTLVADLIAAGLTRPLDNWLSVMEIGTNSINEGGFAMRTMDIDVRGERQVLDQKRTIIPVFATHDDFSFGIRELAAAERIGQPLDDSHIENSIRNVNVAIEDQAWNGLTDTNGSEFKVHGNTAPGVLTSPSNTVVYSGSNKAWDHASKTGAEIVADVLAMVAKAKTVNRRGPFNLYIPTAYDSRLNTNYSDGTTTFDQTIRERLEKITSGGRPIVIKEAAMLPANRTALIQMTSDVIDVIVGQQPTPVSWKSNNGYRTFFLTLACVITRIKVDYNSGSGIVVGNIV